MEIIKLNWNTYISTEQCVSFFNMKMKKNYEINLYYLCRKIIFVYIYAYTHIYYANFLIT